MFVFCYFEKMRGTTLCLPGDPVGKGEKADLWRGENQRSVWTGERWAGGLAGAE